MTRSGALRVGLLALPGIALAVTGATHPTALNSGTAQHWWFLHVLGLFVFPLVAVALGALVWRRRDPLAVVATVAAYVYATCYSALDVISGIGAGWMTDRLGPGVDRPAAISFAFEIGGRLGEIGAWALLVSALAIGVDSVRRHRLPAVAPVVLLVVGSWTIREQHIFPPWGVLACLAIGVATGWLGWLGLQNSRDVGSSMPRSRS